MEIEFETLPLSAFFESLRLNDFPLGIDDYQLLMRALDKLYGLTLPVFTQIEKQLLLEGKYSINDLLPARAMLRLCKLMWLKPSQSTQLFEELFERHFLSTRMNDRKENNLLTDNIISSDGSIPSELPDFPHENTEQPSRDLQTIIEGNLSEDYIQVRIAVGRSQSKPGFQIGQARDIILDKSKFLFSTNYYPIDKRKLEQNLRTFPNYQKTSLSNRVDIEATIKKTLEIGFLKEITYEKTKLNTNNLVLLVDVYESMTAFEQLCIEVEKALVNVLLPANKKEKTFQVFYFYHTASSHLFCDRSLINRISFEKAFSGTAFRQTAVIIISDGGSIGSTNQLEIVKSAQQLLSGIYNFTRKVAWLNPMPRGRWLNTSAEEIAQAVVMNEATADGIKRSVDFLRGAGIKTKYYR